MVFRIHSGKVIVTFLCSWHYFFIFYDYFLWFYFPSFIQISEAESETATERQVVIKGTPESQYKAQYDIFEKIRRERLFKDREFLRSEILVPKSLVGRIIGRGGVRVSDTCISIWHCRWVAAVSMFANVSPVTCFNQNKCYLFVKDAVESAMILRNQREI